MDTSTSSTSPAVPAQQSARDWRRRWRDALVADFLEVDTRWLALQRIAMGLLVLAYVCTLVSQDRLVGFFSDDGMLPLDVLRRVEERHFVWSSFRFAHTPGQALAVFALEGGLALAVTVGLCTRVTAPLAWLGLISIHHRVPHVTNASMVTMHLLGILWVFLPLGRHASIDAWLARRRGESRPPMRIRSLAPMILRLQLFAVYYFNAVQKSGPTWRSGEAVHYVLYSTRAAWPSTVWLRTHEPAWLSPVCSYAALALELSIAVLLVFPGARTWCRRAAASGMLLLHGGIAVLLDVGPFPFVFGTAAFLLLAAEDGAVLDRLLGIHTPRAPAPRDGWTRTRETAREGLLVAHLVLNAYLLWAQNHAMTMVFGSAPAIDVASRIATPLYYAQAWSMFGPDAPRMDRLLVPVVELEDGRVLELETRQVPTFEGLDTRYARVDFFLQIFESQLISRRDGPSIEAYARYQAARPRREGWGGDVRVRELVVHEFLMTRPAPHAPRPAFTASRVVYAQRLRPVAQAARIEF